MGEGDVGVEGVEVAAVLEDLLNTRSGTGKPMPMNMEERDVVVAMKENITGVDLLFVVTDSREEEGDAEDVDKTTTMVKHDPLLIMVLTHSPRPTQLTQLHPSL